MKYYLAIFALMIAFTAHAENLPQPSIDTEPRPCGNGVVECRGYIVSYQKWMDDKGNIHPFATIFIPKEKAVSLDAAKKIADAAILGRKP